MAQQAQFHARKRRKSLAGFQELFRTHLYPPAGSLALPVATITTATAFPSLIKPIAFATRIRITANGGVHRGLVFEFGGTTVGAALWVGDQTIGFHAGASGTANGATALYSRGAELPPGLELELMAAVQPGSGRVRLWANGKELARAQASNSAFTGGAWTTSGSGSFASAPNGTAVSDVSVGSAQAPAGFVAIKPLSIYSGQVPRHFA